MSIIDLGIKKLIEDNALAFATVNKEGKPHNIAVAYCKVVDDHIIITNVHISKTIKNLEFNNNVSLSVWHKEFEEVCVGFELSGTAKNFTEGEWFEFVKNIPNNEEEDVKSAIVVTVSNVKKLES